MQWRLNVLVVQQQPKFEARHRSNGLEDDGLLVVVPELAIERRGEIQRIEVGGMVIAVEHGVDLLESTGLDMLMPVAVFEQFPGIFDHLDR